jgi:hypothetical protein
VAGNGAGGLQWASATPALFIPIVGNVLVPLAGVPLGHTEWSAAQFGIGLLFWPVVLVLIGWCASPWQGMWPERLRPTVFILIAPPAVVGLSALQLGAPVGVAGPCGAWRCSAGLGRARRRGHRRQPFGLPHWGLSFPLAAFAALTLRLAGPGSLLAVLGPLLLALATLVVCALVLGTLRGLRDGSLLAPEPVAAIQPVACGLTRRSIRGSLAGGPAMTTMHPRSRLDAAGGLRAAGPGPRCRPSAAPRTRRAGHDAGAHARAWTRRPARPAIAEVSLYNVFETLTKINSDSRITPLLADSWTVSPDLKTYTFKLRPA